MVGLQRWIRVLRPQREGGSAGGSSVTVGAGNGGASGQISILSLGIYQSCPGALGVFTGGKLEEQGIHSKLTLQVGVMPGSSSVSRLFPKSLLHGIEIKKAVPLPWKLVFRECE